MDTQYQLRNGIALYHGHGNAAATNPNERLWHDAETFHNNDPDAHDRERSWSNPVWDDTHTGANHLSLEARDELVLKAYIAYEHGVSKRNKHLYRPSKFPHWAAIHKYDATTRQPLVPGMPPVALRPPTSAPVVPAMPTAQADLKDETRNALLANIDLIDLEERLGAVEEIALEHLPAMEAMQRTHASLIRDASNALKRQEDLNHQTFADFEERIKNADISKQLLEGLAPLQTRVNAIESYQVRRIEFTIRKPEDTIVTDGVRHEAFEELVETATYLDPWDRNIWMCGPAGSGKTQLAHQLAEALGLPFEFSAALDSSYKISGYKDANSNYNDTPFYRKYKDGGVMLLDEVDFSNPAALSEINAATSNGLGSFPTGMVERHKDFILICAANTWGMGGDGMYVGTARQNAASLDRFVQVEINYDETLERLIAQHDEWVTIVQTCRKAAFEAGAQIVISPRSSIKGAQLLRRGMSKERVVKRLFSKHNKLSTYQTIFAAAIEWGRGATVVGNSAFNKALNSAVRAPSPRSLPVTDFSRTRVRR